MAELTRKEFYGLAHECRDYALRLANHDQDAVERALCREFNQFRQLIHDIAGIHLSEAKKPLVAGRLNKRLRALGMATYGEYFRLVGKDKART